MQRIQSLQKQAKADEKKELATIATPKTKAKKKQKTKKKQKNTK